MRCLHVKLDLRHARARPTCGMTSSARCPLTRQHGHVCGEHGGATLKRRRCECVSWVTDPAAMVTCERLDVQDTVCRLVAAYLLGVGAALSDSEVPSGHLNVLMLPPWSRVAQRCRVRVGVDYNSDDEAWLRDDIPSLEWVGLAARSSAAVDDAATPAAVPAAHLPPIRSPECRGRSAMAYG
jgi:hypothetical protein